MGRDGATEPPIVRPRAGRGSGVVPSAGFPRGSRADGMGDNGIAAAQYRDLYFYSLYRVLEAGLLVLILFGPISELVPEPTYPLLGKATGLAYVAVAVFLLAWALRRVALRTS